MLSENYNVKISDEALETVLELAPHYMHSLRLPDKPISWLDTACVKVEINRPDDCARRELKEEAGVEFKDLIKLTDFHNSPGYSDELFHLYMARVESIGDMEPDGDEEMDMERVIIPMTEALRMIDDQEIVDAKTIIGLLMAARRLSVHS